MRAFERKLEEWRVSVEREWEAIDGNSLLRGVDVKISTSRDADAGMTRAPLQSIQKSAGHRGHVRPAYSACDFNQSLEFKMMS